jgi:hypothetical protein
VSLVELLQQVVKRYKLQKRIDRVAKEVANVAVRAFNLLASLSPVSEEALAERLRDAVMTAVHELSHEVIHSAYPELGTLHNRDPVLECVDEVGARMLEVFVTRKLGARAHSFEDLARELENYPSLREVRWDAGMLEELYSRAEPLLEKRELKGFIDMVVRECRKLLEEKPERRHEESS